MKKIILLLLMIVSIATATMAERTSADHKSGLHDMGNVGIKHFQIGVDYHYSIGLSQHALGSTVTYKDFKMHGNSVHITALYNINSLFTTGLGFGFDSYRPSANTLPVYATFRYRPFQTSWQKDFYCFTNVGYSIPSEDDDCLSSGWLFDLGIGWQRMFRKCFGINLQFGYNLKEFHANRHEYDESMQTFLQSKFNITRNSLAFGFGLVF